MVSFLKAKHMMWDSLEWLKTSFEFAMGDKELKNELIEHMERFIKN